MRIFAPARHILAQRALAMAFLACGEDGEDSASGASVPLAPERGSGTSEAESPQVGRSENARRTTIRLHNASDSIRSRFEPIDGVFRLGVRPLGVEVQRSPTCIPVDCADIPAGETVEPDNECSGPAIAPARRDINPDSWDQDYRWDGIHKRLTQRNCYERVQLEPGVPMIVRACYGEPGTTDWEVINWECTEHQFEYGQATLVIDLE
jgi:hypothetical protein